MQNRKNVSRLSIALLTVLLVTMPLRAQVIVGDSEAPHSFSLLELVAKSPTVGGLRLPQLTDAQCASLKTFFTSGTTSSEDKAAAEGLVVYNTDTHCLFFWGEDDWVSVCNETPDPQACTSPAIVRTSKTSQRIGVGANAIMSVNATSADALSYQWYSGSVGVESFPVEAAQSNSYMPTPVSVGVYSYWCKVSNSCGSVNSSQFTVTVVACGAYISPGVWKKFMCYNLGVTNPSADPFEPSADLIGDYYYWGSPTPAGNRDGNFDWWESTHDLSYYYGDGDGADSPYDFLLITIKSPTDPCPEGYRVPSAREWAGVMYYGSNTKTNYPTGETWSETSGGWYGSMFGDALFLPAAGILVNTSGGFYERGIEGFYWTNASVFPTTAYNTGFSDGGGGLPVQNSRGNSMSVRCIEE